MDRNDSIKISALIGRVIAEKAPYTEYTENDVNESKSDYTEDEINALMRSGYLDGDFEKFFVIREFCNSLGIGDMSGRYLRKLFMLSRKLDADEFESNAYISSVKFDDVKRGNILLTRAEYCRGEIFQYDMPDMSDGMVVLKLGFFTRNVSFPALYEGNIPWVSACPSEINSMADQIKRARGRVLVLGLGLGYFPFMISREKRVESITVVELSGDVIDIFKEKLLPSFEMKEKIEIVHADAIEYLKQVGVDDYDYCFADIWEGVDDGAKFYGLIKPFEEKLFKTEFTYWIENEIREYLSSQDEN